MKARNRSLSPIPIACFNDLDETIKKEVRHAKIKGELIEDKQVSSLLFLQGSMY